MYLWKTPVYLRALACLSLDTATWGERERRDNPSCSLHARAPRSSSPKKNIGNERELKKDTEDEIRKVKKVCNNNLHDISVCKTSLLQGLQE